MLAQCMSSEVERYLLIIVSIIYHPIFPPNTSFFSCWVPKLLPYPFPSLLHGTCTHLWTWVQIHWYSSHVPQPVSHLWTKAAISLKLSLLIKDTQKSQWLKIFASTILQVHPGMQNFVQLHWRLSYFIIHKSIDAS